MKEFNFVCISLFLVLIGCYPQQFTTQEKEQIFTYQVPLSQDSIKYKILTYLSENVNSAKSSLDVSEPGLISGNIILFACNSTFPSMTVTSQLGYIFKFKDGEYKLKLLLKDVFFNSNHCAQSNWGLYHDEIMQSITKFETELHEYILHAQNF